jgi:hypothetical protein
LLSRVHNRRIGSEEPLEDAHEETDGWRLDGEFTFPLDLLAPVELDDGLEPEDVRIGDTLCRTL